MMGMFSSAGVPLASSSLLEWLIPTVVHPVTAARDYHMLPSRVCCLLVSFDKGIDVREDSNFYVLLKLDLS